MQFKDIIGQQPLKENLARMVDSGRISHAQLFVGDEGYGALPLAMAFAQYINCADRHDGDSCGKCPSCVQMEQMAHPDVQYIFPVNKSKSAEATGNVEGDKPVSDHFIGSWREQVMNAPVKGYFNEQMWYKTIDIDNKQGIISRNEASEIIHKLSFKAFSAPYKILIIWLPERMNEQAANTLLKILEEPWERTLFLMVSESPDKLLKTIVSRTQEVSVPSIKTEDLSQWLQKEKYLPADNADNIARLAFGNLLEAQRLTTKTDVEDENFNLFVQLMRLAFEDKHMQLLEWAETAAALGRENQKALLENTVRLLRDAYMLSMGVDRVAYLHGNEYNFCKKFAPYVNNRNIEALVAETERTLRDIAQNGNPKIVFSHYVLVVSKLIVRI